MERTANHDVKFAFPGQVNLRGMADTDFIDLAMRRAETARAMFGSVLPGTPMSELWPEVHRTADELASRIDTAEDTLTKARLFVVAVRYVEHALMTHESFIGCYNALIKAFNCCPNDSWEVLHAIISGYATIVWRLMLTDPEVARKIPGYKLYDAHTSHWCNTLTADGSWLGITEAEALSRIDILSRYNPFDNCNHLKSAARIAEAKYCTQTIQ